MKPCCLDYAAGTRLAVPFPHGPPYNGNLARCVDKQLAAFAAGAVVLEDYVVPDGQIFAGLKL